MQAETTATELIEASAEFLRGEVLPHLAGRAAYLGHVALAALAIAARELAEAERQHGAEAERLRGLLRRHGTREQLRQELCTRIRHGEHGLEDAALMAHLWTTARERLAIDNPGYRALGDGAAPSRAGSPAPETGG